MLATFIISFDSSSLHYKAPLWVWHWDFFVFSLSPTKHSTTVTQDRYYSMKATHATNKHTNKQTNAKYSKDSKKNVLMHIVSNTLGKCMIASMPFDNLWMQQCPWNRKHNKQTNATTQLDYFHVSSSIHVPRQPCYKDTTRARCKKKKKKKN